MVTSLYTHVVVFLATPIVSRSFVHTRFLERKQHTKEYLRCQPKTTRPSPGGFLRQTRSKQEAKTSQQTQRSCWPPTLATTNPALLNWTMRPSCNLCRHFPQASPAIALISRIKSPKGTKSQPVSPSPARTRATFRVSHPPA